VPARPSTQGLVYRTPAIAFARVRRTAPAEYSARVVEGLSR
jgi:hypothetical protein